MTRTSQGHVLQTNALLMRTGDCTFRAAQTKKVAAVIDSQPNGIV